MACKTCSGTAQPHVSPAAYNQLMLQRVCRMRTKRIPACVYDLLKITTVPAGHTQVLVRLRRMHTNASLHVCMICK